MNIKTEHMKRKLYIVAIALCLLPAAAAFGQELRKEKLRGTAGTADKDYAVFYSVGMSENSIWPLGMDLSTDGATIRHTHDGGNGSNTGVDAKIPFRFIIAPADGGSLNNWAVAMGFNAGANTNIDQDGSSAATGCRSYGTTEFPDGWRMPTQREMMIMWLFREGINSIYTGGKIGNDTETRYWSATEMNATKAWYLNFSTTVPQSTVEIKNTALKYRCVRDF